MSDIQVIIELIEKGRKSNEYGDGWGQISTAVAMLKNMQEDSHLHSGQRWELSQILGCGPLYGDIKEAVKELKLQQLTHGEEMGRAGIMCRLLKTWEELGYQDPEVEKQKWVIEREFAFQELRELCDEIGLVHYDKNNMRNAIHRLSSFITDGLAEMAKGGSPDCE
jgi:hypothetical protein